MADNEAANGHTEAATDLEKKIIKQIEFYFGDKNFPKDKFLRQKADEDEGWVTLECLTTFNRLKALSGDTDVIAKALRKSDTGLIEVSEDNKKVRRMTSKPLPQDSVEARQIAKGRTVYCKGFPTDATLDQLEEFFADKGKVIYIFMRRGIERSFKGSVFVEFASADDAKAFVALESVKYNEEELIKMMKDDYFKKKEKEREQYKEKQKEEKQKDDVKKEVKEEEEDKEVKDPIPVVKREDTLQEPIEYDSGCVLHFKNVGEQTSREDLKSLFGEHEDIAWVDFTRGENEGYVRFSKEGGAQRVIDALREANDGKVLIREVEATLRVLEGEEEKKFWVKVQEERAKAREKKVKKSRGGFGGRGRGRGRGKRHYSERQQRKQSEGNEDDTKSTHTRFDDEEEPAAKKVKKEDNDEEPAVKKVKTEED